MAQKPINAWRRDFQSGVLRTVHLERELQLARDLLTVFDGDALLRQVLRFRRRRLPRQIDGDAQQSTRGALYLHQVISQTGYCLFNDLL
ncbi:hypothetical protein D3C78_1667540 [compost metagenome]